MELPSEHQLGALLPELSWLDSQRSAMTNQLLRLAEINSGTFHLAGMARMVDELVMAFETLGGQVELVETRPLVLIDPSGKEQQTQLGPSIHIRKRTQLRPRVLLCIHMDTVYGQDHPFQRCERVQADRLRGPGVADAKGGLVVMLYALRALERSPFAGRLGWEVIINPDEEIGSPGSAPLLQQRAEQADLGLLFEPAFADGSLVSWRKGSGNFVFVVRGRAAHAGRHFEQGRNAIVALARLIGDIDQLNAGADITCNVGKVEGGGAVNIVPDLAIGRVNVRVKTADQQESVQAAFEQLVQRYNRLDGISASRHGSFYSPPKVVDAATRALQRRIEQCAGVLGREITWRGSGGSCDGNKFAAAGLANIDTLGPAGGEIHSPAEYVCLDTLVPCAKLAALVLLSVALPA